MGFVWFLVDLGLLDLCYGFVFVLWVWVWVWVWVMLWGCWVCVVGLGLVHVVGLLGF